MRAGGLFKCMRGSGEANTEVLVWKGNERAAGGPASQTGCPPEVGVKPQKR